MRYDKTLLTKSAKNYKISYSAFRNGIQNDIEDNLLAHKYAKMTFNFNIKDGKLSTGHGFKYLTLLNPNSSDERELKYPSNPSIDGVWVYKDYDAENNQDLDRVVFFNKNDNKLYWVQVNSVDPFSYPLFSEAYVTKPNVVNYRYNGDDCLLISSPNDILRVFKRSQTAEQIENGPKIVSMCVHYERIFAILEGERISLAFSANLDPTNWNVDIDNAGFINFVDERGKLEKVISFNDYVYIFREFGITRVTAYGDQSEFSVNHIFTSSGKIYGNSVCICGDRVMFLASDGIYAFDGYNVVKIDTNLDNFIAKDNAYSIGEYFNGKYYLACKFNYDDNLKIGHENLEYTNNSLVEIDISSGDILITRGVDINSMAVVKFNTFNKLICSFGCGNTGVLFELTNDGIIEDEPSFKYWVSPMSNLGFANQIKHIKQLYILSKKDCEVTISTDIESKTYHVSGKNVTQKIKTNVYGELVKISFVSKIAEADISLPEIVVSVI